MQIHLQRLPSKEGRRKLAAIVTAKAKWRNPKLQPISAGKTVRLGLLLRPQATVTQQELEILKNENRKKYVPRFSETKQENVL